MPIGICHRCAQLALAADDSVADASQPLTGQGQAHEVADQRSSSPCAWRGFLGGLFSICTTGGFARSRSVGAGIGIGRARGGSGSGSGSGSGR